jgi:hypothetical protein
VTDIATLRTDLESLKSSRRSGALRTRFGDREVQYRSDKEMVSAIAALETEIATAQGTPRETTITIRSKKGW